MNRLYRFITIVFLLFSVISCASKAESEHLSPALNAALIGEILVKCDALFKQRDDITKLREAVTLLATARNPDLRDYETEWRFAKYNYFLGKQSTAEKEKETAFEDGVRAGRIASRVEPNKPEGYFWFAASLGEQAKQSPITVGLKSVTEIREAMNKVIEIESDYQSASAYDALAQVELSTAGLMGGKPEKAIEYLQKALTISKENTYIYLHLAEAYLAVGKKDEAKKQLEHLLKMKANPEFMPEYRETTEKARTLLETKF